MGFRLKGFNCSRKDTHEYLSNDGDSVLVGRLKRFQKGDFISINVNEFNFVKKVLGEEN